MLKFDNDVHFQAYLSFISQRGYSNNDRILKHLDFKSATSKFDDIFEDESFELSSMTNGHIIENIAFIEGSDEDGFSIKPIFHSRTIGMILNQDRQVIVDNFVYIFGLRHVYRTPYDPSNTFHSNLLETDDNIVASINVLEQSIDGDNQIDSRTVNMCLSGLVECEDIDTVGRHTKLYANVRLIYFVHSGVFPLGSVFEVTSAHERRKSFGCCWNRYSADYLEVGIRGYARFYDLQWNQVCQSYDYGDMWDDLGLRRFSCTNCHTAHRTLINTNPSGTGQSIGLLGFNCSVAYGAYYLCLVNHQSSHLAKRSGKRDLNCLIGY